MAESLDLLSLVMDTRLLEAAANECHANHRASSKACNRIWRKVSERYKPGGNQTAHVVPGKVMLSKRIPEAFQDGKHEA
jgi:hypothetical protein